MAVAERTGDGVRVTDKVAVRVQVAAAVFVGKADANPVEVVVGKIIEPVGDGKIILTVGVTVPTVATICLVGVMEKLCASHQPPSPAPPSPTSKITPRNPSRTKLFLEVRTVGAATTASDLCAGTVREIN